MAVITLDNVKIIRGSDLILDIDHLEVAEGELLVVLGPSGAGKSMLLRAIAGLERLDTGSVRFDGVDITNVKTAERGIAMVFQDHVLYPFLNVRDNIAFPLKLRRAPSEEIAARVEAEARVLEIEHLLTHRPRELGAGHQQLVQAARVFVRAPEAFLLDEPLTMLDPQLRAQTRREIRLLQQGYGVTTLLATNDHDEAMAMADRLAVIDKGTISQIAEPMDLYERPRNRFVAGFVGAMAFVTARLVSDTSGFWVEFGGFRMRAWTPALADASSPSVEVGLRAADIVADPTGIPVRVGTGYFLGSYGMVQVELAPGEWAEMRTAGPPPRQDSTIRIRLRRLQIFDLETGLVLGRVEDGAG
jgi:ABC-type sugar transport system ATPase subunit